MADEFGNSYHIVVGGQVKRVVSAPIQPGGGAASNDGKHVVGVGVRDRRITEYRANGDAVLGFMLTPHGPKQVATIPTGAGSKPYGLAYDATRHTLWTTLTGRNQVLGLTFNHGRIVHKSLKATVQQPNTLAIDHPPGRSSSPAPPATGTCNSSLETGDRVAGTTPCGGPRSESGGLAW
ncbi:hypothetical protein [Sciscionella marina]|uniref:hypothetical protein n=1 Tax=Sciscionella marina TaxID=508770 RepID=UPI0012F64EF6|nr:hypothetical protein [Sciscionella marina]